MSTASAVLAGCRKGNEKLIPFLIAPEDSATPGLANYYASTCRQCPAGCGIVVKVSEGRAKKIEGNPLHPVNRGRLCSRGQAALQELYHPDRIRTPLKRTGDRGAGTYMAVSWEEAIDDLVTRLAELKESGEPDRLTFITPQIDGSEEAVLNRFMDSFGTSNHLAWELLSPEWLLRATRSVFGVETVPDYDIANTQYLLSFGADFIETHLSPVRYGNGFGAMRQTRPTIRGRFTYVGARMSLTAASADRWLPARPGSEGALAMAMARELVTSGRFSKKDLRDAGIVESDLRRLLQKSTLENAARATGLPMESLRAAAREVTTISPAIAIAGESVAWQSNGLESAKAILLLNILLGNTNRPGGIYLPVETAGRRQSSHEDLLDFVKKVEDGDFRMALIYRSNLLHSLPPALGLRQALPRIPYIVSFSNFLDETTSMADLILPGHSDLESWGDISPDRGVRHPVIGLMQPVVKRQHDTRSFAEILLAVGRGIAPDMAAAMPWPSEIDLIRDTLFDQLPPDEDRDGRSWNRFLQRGGYFDTTSAAMPGRVKSAQLPRLRDAVFYGSEDGFPFHLHLYPSANIYDGRNAHLPWLQQLPDPMTTVVWDSWVEVSPVTAAKQGIRHGDLVEVSTASGSLQLPAVIYPGLHPEVLAIPIGQGHEGFGRYADKRGTNPLKLLAAVMDEDNRLPAWGATRCNIRAVSTQGDLVTAGHPDGSYRRDMLGL